MTTKRVRQYVFQRELDSNHIFDINPWFDLRLIHYLIYYIKDIRKEDTLKFYAGLGSSATSLTREV